MSIACRLAAWLLLLLGFSWRLRRTNLADYDARLAAGERCIYAFWHARMLPLVFTHRHRGIAVLVSRHRDGEWIARVIEALGFVTARGSSTRGGEEGVREMLEWAERGHLLAVTPDGPRGPREVVKPGLVWLASRTGLPIVPVATSGTPSRVFDSWDRFRVPLPFARTVVTYGEPIQVPAALGEEGMEGWQARITDALRALTHHVALATGEERA
jgi:lysophospholipid acyltransferase (LPLAT)-like uncharacterized protein